MQYYERSAWTSVPRPVSRLTALDSAQLRGLAVHYTGSSAPLGSRATLQVSARRLEDERAFHTQGRGWSDIAYCLPVSTQALTQRGWLCHDEIMSDDVLYTLNLETGLGEWQHAEAVTLFAGPRQMLQDHRGLRSTPNHRWPVWRGHTNRYVLVESSQLTGYHQVPVCARSASQPSQPKYTDDFVALVAWFWTEGHIAKSRGKDSNGAMIYQSHTVNPSNVAAISAALTRLYGPQSAQLRLRDTRVCPRGHALAEGNLYHRPNGRTQCRTCWIAQSRTALPVIDVPPRWSARQTGTRTTFYLNATIGAELQRVAEPPDKVVRRDFLLALTPAQLDLFVRVSIQADGTTPAEGGPTLAQKSAARSDAFAFACVLAGHAISYGMSTTPQGRTMHSVSVLRRRTVIPALHGMEQREHEGAVWCPTTPNRTWLARDGQHVFFTGNSAAIDVEGRVFDCRGAGYRSAANGNATVNQQYGAVTWLLGAGDQPTAAMVNAFREWRQAYWLQQFPRATAVVGHRDLYSTECPGDPAYALVRSGALTAGGTVPLTDAEIDAIATRTRDKILAVTYGNQLDGRPFTLAMLWGELRVNAIKAATGIDLDALATAIVAKLPAGNVNPQLLASAVADELSLRLKG